MELLKEIKNHGLLISSMKAKVHFRVFEDSSGDLEITRINKYRPRNKHLNNRLYHFRSYVDAIKEITIHPINTKDQPADMPTKALNVELLTKFRKIIMG